MPSRDDCLGCGLRKQITKRAMTASEEVGFEVRYLLAISHTEEVGYTTGKIGLGPYPYVSGELIHSKPKTSVIYCLFLNVRHIDCE